MTCVWGAPRGPIKALAVLGLLVLGLLSVATAGPSWAGAKLLVPNISSIIS